MHIDYSTNAVSAREKFDYWHEAVCHHLIRAQAKPEMDGHFDGSLKYRSYAGINIASQQTDSHVWERTARCLKLDHDDDLWLGYMDCGKGFIEQNGLSTPIHSGDIVIYDAARTFRYQYQTQGMHIIRLPRSWIMKRAPQTESLAGTVLNNYRPGISTLKHMILECASDAFEQAPVTFTDGYADTLFELITLTLRSQSDAPPRKNGKDLYPRIMKYITENLSDNTLSLSTIAAAHHVSTRTVTRLFALHQQTAMSVVWQKRLQACRTSLTEGSACSITALAFDHGFSDLSHFSQSFKKAYGVTPASLLPK